MNEIRFVHYSILLFCVARESGNQLILSRYQLITRIIVLVVCMCWCCEVLATLLSRRSLWDLQFWLYKEVHTGKLILKREHYPSHFTNLYDIFYILTQYFFSYYRLEGSIAVVNKICQCICQWLLSTFTFRFHSRSIVSSCMFAVCCIVQKKCTQLQNNCVQL